MSHFHRGHGQRPQIASTRPQRKFCKRVDVTKLVSQSNTVCLYIVALMGNQHLLFARVGTHYHQAKKQQHSLESLLPTLSALSPFSTQIRLVTTEPLKAFSLLFSKLTFLSEKIRKAVVSLVLRASFLSCLLFFRSSLCAAEENLQK